MRFLKSATGIVLLCVLIPFFSFCQSKNTDQVTKVFTDTRLNIDSLEKFVKSNLSLGIKKKVSLLDAVNDAKKFVDYQSYELSKLSDDKQIDSLVIEKYILEARNMSAVIHDAYRSKDIVKIDTVLKFINLDLKSKLFIPAKNAFPDGHGRDCPPMCDPGRPNNVNTGRYLTVQVTVKVIGKKSGKSLIGYNVFAKPQYSLNISLVDTSILPIRPP
jgi:hypothetical protein